MFAMMRVGTERVMARMKRRMETMTLLWQMLLEGNQTAQHCSQQRHLDGIQQWFDDFREIGEIGLKDLAHDDAEFMAALDEDAEVEVGDLEGDDDDNQQDECDQWCP